MDATLALAPCRPGELARWRPGSAGEHCQTNFKILPYRDRQDTRKAPVMKFLRTVSTQRLLAIIAGVILAVAGGTAIAVAASNGGPKPPKESLATALHQAAGAPAVTGITARIQFTNNLINASDLQGTDPILNGATGRLWLSNNGQLRLELQGDNGDAQVVVNNGSFSIYDPMSNTVYKGTLPQQSSSSSSKQKSSHEAIPTVAELQKDINQFAQDWKLVGPTPRNVAGQPAYKIRISPRHDGGLLGDVQLAWDAARGVPLGIAIYSNSSKTPVLELKATSISYGAVSAKVFKIKPPAGAHVVQITSPAGTATAASKRAHKAGKGGKAGKANAQATTPAQVQAKLPFTLAAPNPLVGLQRQSVSVLNWGGSPAALVTYGQGLGGIAVIERQGQASSQSQSGGGTGQGLSLPTVSINGATGQELSTPLGTVITFSKNGVDYTVLGSVPAVAANAAAKALTS
jgi:outer membrane lipoprotein-sorting protein